MIERMAPFILPGVIYGIGAIGLSLPLRFLRFPDLTVLGSIMLGGVICIRVTSTQGPLLGLAIGTIAGLGLGSLTGCLSQFLGIDDVLAGIITFTAASTPGYLFTSGGTIGIDGGSHIGFSAVYNNQDLFILLAISLALATILGLGMRTKPGLLLLAMSASKGYIDVRHRYRRSIFIFGVALGNGIVAFAGGLFALRSRQASVDGHLDFLPFALGAVCGGSAALGVLKSWYHVLQKKFFGNSSTSNDQEQTPLRKKAAMEFRRGGGYTWLFLSYVAGCLCITLLSGIVSSNAFSTISPYLNISPDMQYLATAVLLVLAVVWYRGEKK
jgi:putative tryptophan/tyrosine transport system permease protein